MTVRDGGEVKLKVWRVPELPLFVELARGTQLRGQLHAAASLRI